LHAAVTACPRRFVHAAGRDHAVRQAALEVRARLDRLVEVDLRKPAADPTIILRLVLLVYM
jgi:hypothetical protein